MSETFIAIVGAALVTLGLASASAAPVEGRQKELVNLIKHDCGSCHGMNLTGGLGPQLLPARVAEMSDESLIEAILHGRKGTPMPPWTGQLSKEEALWIVLLLKKGVPK
jgi:cytochrome c55X|tara:strand:- start:44 stop:370 length:327 start_codon:yes stop_codon:yes gene_type:complete